MQQHLKALAAAQIGDVCSGFRLVKKEFVASKNADFYTLRHEKTGTELVYFDRADENKTFAICFKTLPENDTGVFHILEHSVLNGSRKFPVKEPFVSMLQSSMQTYLNALTYSDKTLYPVASRNEQDLFNLMSVYLDAVFCPLIYEKPEIFMQEGWHYEFDEDGTPSYNGVVFSEMKGAFADVDTLIECETSRLLFPDTCYSWVSGGHPEHITDLTYEQFVATHKRFYHPSNARIFLDGHMDVDRVLRYVDEEYLSKCDYRAPDFDFVLQTPKTGESTVCYEAQEGEEELCHMAVAKLLCTYRDVEKIYAAKVLANYLTGSNEAPLKRALLERGLGQDVSIEVNDGVYQPSIKLTVRNTDQANFAAIKAFLPEFARNLCETGLNREGLLAALERFAFVNREISEPYGLELAGKALDSWLYGGNPLTHIDNAGIFEALRAKVDTDYFSDLLLELFGSAKDKCYLYVLPSLTKGEEDARREAERAVNAASAWSAEEREQVCAAVERMQQWQCSEDSEEVLASLPHLNLADVAEQVPATETKLHHIAGREVLESVTDTNGIVYLSLFFDVSDFTAEELCELNVLTACFGEVRTEHYTAAQLQTKIKAVLGGLYAKIELAAKPGDLEHCTPYLLVSASMLEENVPTALELIEEVLLHTRYDEPERIQETVLQLDYYLKQALIGNGHAIAITRSTAPFSKVGAVQELLEGETFVRWFAEFSAGFEDNAPKIMEHFAALTTKAFCADRLFAGYSGALEHSALVRLVQKLPTGGMGAPTVWNSVAPERSAVEIPADVGFSALGNNLYARGAQFTGEWAVLSSLVTYAYLWNAVRVQGGAYGTGMAVRMNGDVFCYSYRDPNLAHSEAAFQAMAEALRGMLGQGMPLDDIIIGTVNTTDPLLAPSAVAELECVRYLKGITAADIARIRREILHTTPEKLLALADVLDACMEKGTFCAVGGRDAVAFVKEN